MSTTSTTSDLHPPVLRQALLVLGAVIAFGGLLAGTGVFGGTPIGEVGGGDLAPDASLVVPAGIAFSIWTPIYLGLLGLGVWQALPAQRLGPTAQRTSRVAWPLLVSMVANTGWIVAAQAQLTWWSVVVIVTILGSLAVAYARLVRDRPTSRVEHVLLDGTTGLYLGWVCVATVANVSTTLVSAGYGDLAPGREVWAVAVLVVAALVGVLVTLAGRGRLAFPFAVTWALVWVVVARTGDGPPSTAAAVTAGVGAAAVAGTAVASRLRARSARLAP